MHSTSINRCLEAFSNRYLHLQALLWCFLLLKIGVGERPELTLNTGLYSMGFSFAHRETSCQPVDQSRFLQLLYLIDALYHNFYSPS